MANRVEYIKIARIDQDGSDLTNTLEALTKITIPYTSGASPAVYPIESITRYNDYFLYKVGMANRTPDPNDSGSLEYNFTSSLTSSIGGGTGDHIVDLLTTSGTPLNVETVIKDFSPASFNSNKKVTQVNTYPQKPIAVRISGSATGLGSSGNSPFTLYVGGNGISSIATLSNSGTTNFDTTISIPTSSQSPGMNIYPAFTIYGGNTVGFTFAEGTTMFITSSVASGPTKETIPEPYLTSRFYGGDCDVLLNNVSLYPENPFLQDLDYNGNPNSPTNFQLIVSGTAARGTVPESYYTSLAQTRIRYAGVKNQSEKVNVYPPNGKSFALEDNFFQNSPITGISGSNRISSIASTSEPAIVAGTSSGLFGGFITDSSLDSTYFRSVEANHFPSWGGGAMTKTNVLELDHVKLKTLARDYSNVQIYFSISAEVDVTDGDSANPSAKLQVGLFSFQSGSTANIIPRAGEIIDKNGANSYYVSSQSSTLLNDTLNQSVSLTGNIPISVVTNIRKYLGLAIVSTNPGTDATRYNFSNVSVSLSLQGVPLNIGTFGQTSPIDSLDTNIYEFEWGGGTTPEILDWGAIKMGRILQVSSKNLIKNIDPSSNVETITIPSKRGTTSGRARNYRVIAGNPSGTQYPPNSINTSSVGNVHFWDTPQNIGDYHQVLNGNNPVNTEISMYMYPNSTAGSNPTLPSITKILTTEWGVPTISNYALTSSNSQVYGSISSSNSPRRFINLDREVHISKVTTDSNGYYQSAAYPIKPNWATIGDQINNDLNNGEKWFVTIYNEFEFPNGQGDYNSVLTTGSLSPFNDGITVDSDGNYSNALGYKGVYEIAGVYDNFTSDFGIMLYDDFPDFGGNKAIGGNTPGNSLGMLIWKARATGKNEFVIVQDSITGGVQGGAFINRYAPNYITENFEEITKEYGSNQTG
jgi:hypothetical protein